MIHFFMTESSFWLEDIKNALEPSPVPPNFINLNKALLVCPRKGVPRGMNCSRKQTATPWRNCGREPVTNARKAEARRGSPAAGQRLPPLIVILAKRRSSDTGI
jgi:hypothetical protein